MPRHKRPRTCPVCHCEFMTREANDERPAHSIKRHPLQEVLNPEEFRRLVDDVQFCRVSWPVGIEIVTYKVQEVKCA